MANPVHLDVLGHGVSVWNQWRRNNVGLRPDLNGADLRNRDLVHVDFYGTDLRSANLAGAHLMYANLNQQDLTGTDLTGACLLQAHLFEVDLTVARLGRTDFGETNLKRAILDGLDLSGQSINRALLEEARMRGAKLEGTMFIESSLAHADLSGANLRGARFDRANLFGTDLSKADLRDVNLTQARMIGTVLNGANLTNALVYGVSVWDLQTDVDTRQQDLVLTPPDQSKVTTDNLKIAQFIYLLLRNPEIRNVIDTLTAKVVLILGRFTPERKGILEALRIALRGHGLVPVLFDFDRPANRDVSETVLTLACMSLFVIVDLSAPRSAPLELQLTVPQVMVPVVPIIQEKEQPFDMFRNLEFKYDWVLKPLHYHSEDDLIGSLEKSIIGPACEKANELRRRRAQDPGFRSTFEHLRTQNFETPESQ
jgi:uncharacterized protein YjbI with pentapeptide repeats